MADILIVEDDLDAGATLESALCAKGHSVFRAFSLAEALSIMDGKLRPDLILLDRGLPDTGQ